jgi:hypothetical protein
MASYRVDFAATRREHCLLGVEVVDEWPTGYDWYFVKEDRDKVIEVTYSRIVFDESNKISSRRILVAIIPDFDIADLIGKTLVPVSRIPESDSPPLTC